MQHETAGQGDQNLWETGAIRSRGPPRFSQTRFERHPANYAWKGQIMHKTAHGMRRSYKAGCRCDLCKQAESAYKRDLRRRHREAVGEFVTGAVPSLSLVAGGDSYESLGAEPVRVGMSVSYRESVIAPRFSPNTVTAAVSLEISEIGAHSRPGLAAAAIAMARILDNPKAVSSQPPAAKVLSALLDKLRSASGGRSGRLAVVRSMTPGDSSQARSVDHSP